MILIVDNHSKNVPLIKSILRKLKVRFIVKNQKSLFKSFDYHKIKGVILSGGRPDLDKKIYLGQIKADVSCLINYDVPILGICEGHEIIGEACGGEILKMKKPSKYRNLDIKIIKRSKIFKGLPKNIKAYEHHSRYVKCVPKELCVAATSRKDKVEALFHKKKQIFSVQFHPEKSGEFGEKIIKNFVEICSK